MPSVKSYFNTTLYRKYLTRFWPIWALYVITWFFILPVNLILRAGGIHESAEEFADLTVLQLLPQVGLGMAVAMGILSAMAIWSYLYGSRSSGLIHALPIRREGLFLTGFLAGVTFFLVPNAVIFIFTLAAEAMAGTVNLGVLVLWFAVQTMFCLFFFCFATLCAFVTGHILALPAFYFIFQFLAVGVLALIENALQNFVYGFAGLTAAWPVVEAFSPLYCIVDKVELSYEWESGAVTRVVLHGVPTMIAYTVIGLVLAALALLLYRRHRVERAGEVVTAGWLRPVFKYGVAFCGALALGTLFHTIFSEVLGQSAWGMLFFFLLWGFLSYFAAEMLLQKTFRVFHRRSWRNCAVFLLVLTAATAAMELDLTGYERRVPDSAGIAHASVSNVSTLPYDSGQICDIDTSDAALISRIVSLHASAVDQKKAVEQDLRDFSYSDFSVMEDGVSIQDANQVRFTLTYTLENGREICRAYTIPVTGKLLGDPSSPAALLLDLLNNRQNIAASYFPAGVTAADFFEGTVSFPNMNGDGAYEEVRLTAEEAGAVYEAALQDMATGGLGRRYLLADGAYLTEVYENQICLTCYGTYPGWTSGTEDEALELRFYIQTDSARLIGTLTELGILDEDHALVTMLEQQKTGNIEKYDVG